MEPSSSTTPKAVSNILCLPDDCLTMILDQLDFHELMLVRSTCKQFNATVASCMKRHRLRLEIEYVEYDFYFVRFDNDASKTYQYTYNGLSRIFQKFENRIISIQLVGEMFNCGNVTQILYLANQYCGKYLKSLSLKHVKINSTEIRNFWYLFKYLRHFSILADYDDIPLDGCINLCENLTSISALYNRIYYPDANFFDFIGKNPNLKHIKFLNIATPVRNYLNQLNDVRTLFIHLDPMNAHNINGENWIRLLQFKNLKQLELKIEGEQIINALLSVSHEPVTNIESFGVNVQNVEFILYIFKAFTFRNLTRIVLSFDFVDGTESYDQSTIETIARNLFNVKEFHILDFSINVSYQFVLEIMKNSQNLHTVVMLPRQREGIIPDRVLDMIRIQQRKKKLLTIKYGKYLKQVFDEAIARNNKKLNYINFEYIDNEAYEFNYLRTIYFQI